LAPGGMLLFDFVTGTAWRGVPLSIIQHLKHPDFVVTSRIHTLPARRLSVVDMRLTRAPASAGRKEWREVHVQRWYPLSMVRDLARRAGLRVCEVEDLDRDCPATDASHWVHFVATPSSRG
jgi:hypothetical protein